MPTAGSIRPGRQRHDCYQATAAKPGAVTRLVVTRSSQPLVTDLYVGWSPDPFPIPELAAGLNQGSHLRRLSRLAPESGHHATRTAAPKRVGSGMATREATANKSAENSAVLRDRASIKSIDFH